MNKNMNLPAEYAVLSEEEMTYTQGGSDIGGFATTAATVVGAVVLGASYIWHFRFQGLAEQEEQP